VKWMINIGAAALAWLLLGILALLSVRGLVDPAGAAASFGVPLPSPEAVLYQQVYRSRNLVLALTGMALLVTGAWRPLAILTSLSIALPLFDIWIIKAAGLPVAAVHPATLVGLVLLAILVWARVRQTPT